MADDLCRGCQAQIRWVKTVAGKAMPVDLALTTTDDEKVVLFDAAGARLTARNGVARTGHVPHWATCPVRDRFKTQRRAP